jgi:hypothetical protein
MIHRLKKPGQFRARKSAVLDTFNANILTISVAATTMTLEERNLCRDLIVTPPHGVSQISKEEFVRRFPLAVAGGKLAPSWLEEAYKAQNAEELQCALAVGFTFGFAPEHKEIFRRLIGEDWHYSHEDVVSALETWPVPDTVEALFRATQWIPKSLEYDDSRALAVKAIWALGKIPGTEADASLKALARSDDIVLRKTAVEQLERRTKRPEPLGMQ